jgi:hypothetical protein
VIGLKKNGVDIQMCIDYRVVNGFIKLSSYPLPLIDDLLVGFERAMWEPSSGRSPSTLTAARKPLIRSSRRWTASSSPNSRRWLLRSSP